MNSNEELKIGDRLYYARIIPQTGTYDVCDIKIRSIYDDYFVGVDKSDKKAYLLYKKDIDKIVFKDRLTALELVLDAEKNKKTFEIDITED